MLRVRPHHILPTFTCVFLAALGVSGCGQFAALGQAEGIGADRDVALEWNDLALELIRADRSAPGGAVRDLALMHAAMFDAVNSIERKHGEYLVSLDAPAGASPRAAAAAAAATVLLDRHHQHHDRIEETLKSTVGSDQASDDGARVGVAVALRLLDRRRDDGWDARQPYAPPQRAGIWRPVPPDFAQGAAPTLGELRPFVMKSVSQFRLAGVPPLLSAEYVEEFNFVRDFGAKESRVRTSDQTAAVRFWSDGAGTFTPAGHWNHVYTALAQQYRYSWRANLRHLALLNLALADAAVIDYDHKYTFNRWRPITAIRSADTDANRRTVPAKDWEPFLPTPSAPAYVSGLSAFAGAADSVLIAIFGETSLTVHADRSVDLPPRDYASIRQAAEEAGWSRVYAGVHWPSDHRDGLSAGRRLGAYVAEHLLRPL